VISKQLEQLPDFDFLFYERGEVRLLMEDFDGAIADYGMAIDADDDGALYFNARGKAYALKGDHARAIADHERAVAVDSNDSWQRLKLGIARFDGDDFAGAARELLRVLEMEDNATAMLYRFLARTRAGESAAAELEANATRLKTRVWPYAAIELFLGRRSPEAMLDVVTEEWDRCEAQFYLGEWQVLKGDASAAAAAFTAAVEICSVRYSYIYPSARAELRRLADRP
jgi:lipoprotein NlpI